MFFSMAMYGEDSFEGNIGWFKLKPVDALGEGKLIGRRPAEVDCKVAFAAEVADWGDPEELTGAIIVA